MPSYLAVGHLTLDRLPQGDRAGGTVLYAARYAASLGWKARIVTATPPEWLDQIRDELSGIEIHHVDASEPTTFAYSWHEGVRTQLLTHVAPSLGAGSIPREWLSSDVWHLGPVAGEVEPQIIERMPPNEFLGLTPQGWMRRTDAASVVHREHWEPAGELVSRANAIVFSRDDVDAPHDLARRLSDHGPLVAVTAAEEGSTLYHRQRQTDIPAVPITPKSELGAGDVYAAALFIARYSGAEPEPAGRLATTAAARVLADG